MRSKYGVTNISVKDFSRNNQFKNLLFKSNLTARTVDSLAQELDYTKVTEITLLDSSVVYSIPFLSDAQESLVVKGSNYTHIDSVDRIIIIKNHIGKVSGSGAIEIWKSDEHFSETYSSGVLTSYGSYITPSPELSTLRSSLSFCQRQHGETFRHCFDRMYDTVCDGFWGCVAWYAYPEIPIIAAVMCSCYK
jgi:hypothetical protein